MVSTSAAILHVGDDEVGREDELTDDLSSEALDGVWGVVNNDVVLDVVLAIVLMLAVV